MPSLSRPSSASPSPLHDALCNHGLQQYSRRLNEMGFTCLRHVLRLGRSDKLDELFDNLRPMPGHRVRLLNFIEEERARAQANAAYAKPPVVSEQTATPPMKSAKPTTSAVPRTVYTNRQPVSAKTANSMRAATRSTATVPSTAEAAAEAAVAAAAAASHAAT